MTTDLQCRCGTTLLDRQGGHARAGALAGAGARCGRGLPARRRDGGAPPARMPEVRPAAVRFGAGPGFHPGARGVERALGDHRAGTRGAALSGGRRGTASRGRRPAQGISHPSPARGRLAAVDQPARAGELALSPAARAQPGRLAALGRRGVRRGARARPAGLPDHRLRDLPLVPRDGGGVVRGAGHRADPQRAVRRGQGRPRGAPRRRRHLHAGGADAHPARRLADERLAHRRTASRSSPAPTSPRATASAARGAASSPSCASWTGSGARSAQRATQSAGQIAQARAAEPRGAMRRRACRALHVLARRR